VTGRDEAYDALIESLAKEYGPKALDYLKSIALACHEHGLASVGPYDLSDDYYRWSMKVWRTSVRTARDEDSIDVTIEIAEERGYESEPCYGLNFGLDLVEYGGRVIGVWAPYNYTPLCWVDVREPQEVADRWSMFASADVNGIPDLILEAQG
jgi:hypothetical protein